MKILAVILLCLIPGLIGYPVFLAMEDSKDNLIPGKNWKGIMIYILRAILFSLVWPLFGILYFIAIIVEKYQDKRKVFKQLKGLVNGIDEEDHYHHDDKLRFCQMGGAGNLYCRDCGYEEYIVSFLHGFEDEPDTWHESGYQCQKCGKMTSIEKDLRMKKIPKCECGGELSRDEGLFCPVCRSFKVEYKLKIIT